MIFPSKRDLGVALIALPVRLGMVGAGAYFLSWLITQGGSLFLLLPEALLVGLGVLTLWAFFSTAYEITATTLVVRFGPLRGRIPLDAIVEIVPNSTLRPDRAWGAVWAVDRLVIRYRRRNGRPAFLGVAVSPRDKEGFLRELTQARGGHDNPLGPGVPVLASIESSE